MFIEVLILQVVSDFTCSSLINCFLLKVVGIHWLLVNMPDLPLQIKTQDILTLVYLPLVIKNLRMLLRSFSDVI